VINMTVTAKGMNKLKLQDILWQALQRLMLRSQLGYGGCALMSNSQAHKPNNTWRNPTLYLLLTASLLGLWRDTIKKMMLVGLLLISASADAKSDFLQNVIQAYIARRYEGNLLDLLDAAHWLSEYLHVDNSMLSFDLVDMLSLCDGDCNHCGFCQELFQSITHRLPLTIRDNRAAVD